MSIWKQLYQAYENKDCEKFKELWANLSEEDKNSPYFSKYQSLFSKLCPPDNKKGKILLKGKTIKCPHCGSPISKSTFNLESIKKLKQGQDNITFVCNYCGTEFTWSKTPFKTIFSDYTIGKEIEIKGNTYKLAGAVKYEGTYNEKNIEVNFETKDYGLGYGLAFNEEPGSGKLEYIEWLAYDKKGEIYYISESRAKDNEGVYDEIEITKKVNFPFVIQDYNNYKIDTNLGQYLNREIDTVQVVQVYGEVNKSYKIGEKIKIYNFENYSLEIEATDNGIERNLYQKVNNNFSSNNFRFLNSNKIGEYIVIFIIGFAIILPFISALTKDVLNGILKRVETKQTIGQIRKTKTIGTGNFEYDFSYPLTKTTFVESYDYGGKKYKKSILKGFNFSIKDNKDKNLFLKFINNPKIINNFPKTPEVNNILINNQKIITSNNDLIIKYK